MSRPKGIYIMSKPEWKILVTDYSYKAKKGTRVKVDAFRLGGAGGMFRVVNIWKEPRWFNAKWLKAEGG